MIKVLSILLLFICVDQASPVTGPRNSIRSDNGERRILSDLHGTSSVRSLITAWVHEGHLSALQVIISQDWMIANPTDLGEKDIEAAITDSLLAALARKRWELESQPENWLQTIRHDNGAHLEHCDDCSAFQSYVDVESALYANERTRARECANLALETRPHSILARVCATATRWQWPSLPNALETCQAVSQSTPTGASLY
jgi:hypothetical protein